MLKIGGSENKQEQHPNTNLQVSPEHVIIEGLEDGGPVINSERIEHNVDGDINF